MRAVGDLARGVAVAMAKSNPDIGRAMRNSIQRRAGTAGAVGDSPTVFEVGDMMIRLMTNEVNDDKGERQAVVAQVHLPSITIGEAGTYLHPEVPSAIALVLHESVKKAFAEGSGVSTGFDVEAFCGAPSGRITNVNFSLDDPATPLLVKHAVVLHHLNDVLRDIDTALKASRQNHGEE